MQSDIEEHLMSNYETNSNNICLAMCCLELEDELVKILNEFNSNLHKNGYQLFLLTTSHSQKAEFPIFNIPFSLKGYDDFYPNIQLNSFAENDSTINTLIERDIAWNSDDVNQFENYQNGYAKCRFFFKSLIDSLKPSIALTWSTALPQSIVFKNLLDSLSIPNFVWERGLLPNTFMLESKGNSGFSDLNTNIFGTKFDVDKCPQIYNKIKKYYRDDKPIKYTQSEFIDSKSLREEWNIAGNKIITFFGQHDVAFGVYPPNTYMAKINSPLFDSTEDALKSLGDSIKNNPETVLLFKPHPNDQTMYEDNPKLENIRIIRDTNIHSLFELSDIFVFTSSTLQFESLFYEKPIVLLANSELRNKGVAYECQQQHLLADTIEMAINQVGFNVKFKKMKGFISWIIQHFLIGYNKSVPTSKSMTEFAKILSDNGVSNAVGETLEERINKFSQLHNELLTTGETDTTQHDAKSAMWCND